MRIDWYELRVRADDLWSRVRVLDPRNDPNDRRLVVRAAILAFGVILIPVFVAVVARALPDTSEVERAAREARVQLQAQAPVSPESLGRFAAQTLRPALASDPRFAALIVQPEPDDSGSLALVVRGSVPTQAALNDLRLLVESTAPPAPVYLEVRAE